MTYRRIENPDGSWAEEYSGPELADLLAAEPEAECSACRRKTWDSGMVGLVCYMLQPDGSTCAGVFKPLTERK